MLLATFVCPLLTVALVFFQECKLWNINAFLAYNLAIPMAIPINNFDHFLILKKREKHETKNRANGGVYL